MCDKRFSNSSDRAKHEQTHKDPVRHFLLTLTSNLSNLWIILCKNINQCMGKISSSLFNQSYYYYITLSNDVLKKAKPPLITMPITYIMSYLICLETI